MLIVSLLFLPFMVANVAGTGNYAIFPHTLSYGGTQITGANSVESCKRDCNDDEGCYGFDFDGNNNCFKLKKGMTQVNNNDVTQYLKYGCYTKYDGKISYGGREIAGASSVEHCKIKCDQDPSCHGFDFDESNRCFALDKGMVQYKNPTVTQYLKCGCYSKYDDTKSVKRSKKLVADDVNSCKSLCDSDVMCRGFDFQGNECWALDVSANQKYDNGVTQYLKCACFIKHENTQSIGGTKIPEASGLDACKSACHKNKDCYGFDFANGECWALSKGMEQKVSEGITQYLRCSCNGAVNTCKLPFNQATFPGTHNTGAGFDGRLEYDWGILGWPDAISCFYRCQDQSVTKQLQDGIRFFDLDICYHDKKMYACHKDAYGGHMSKMFDQMRNFLNLNSNRNQVIVLRVSDVNDINTGNSYKLWELMKNYFSGDGNTVGLNDFHSRMGRWPTLEEAARENKRVFVFAKPEICDTHCFNTNRWLITENSMGDTYKSRPMTSSCSGIVDDTKNQCESKKDKTFILDSHFGSYGVCIWDMAKLCDGFLPSAVRECATIRNAVGKSVNFIMVDYYNKAPSSQNVVYIANLQNTANYKRWFNINK